MGRLFFSLIFLAIGAMGLIVPPTHGLWYLSLGATEWGHWLLVPILLIVLVPGWHKTGAGQWGAVLALVAAVLAVMPAVKARTYARQVQSDVAKLSLLTAQASSVGAVAVPQSDRLGRPAPFVLQELYSGVPFPSVEWHSQIYTKRGEREMEMDVYMPPASAASAGAATQRPVVLVFHGGLTGGPWQSGDRQEAVRFNQYLAGRGYIVASADYRLAPDAPYPAAFEDAQAALETAKKLGGGSAESANVVVMGRGGGGHLALMTAYGTGDPSIRGVVALYPPTDLAVWAQAPVKPALADQTAWLRAFLGTGPEGPGAALYRAASPVTLASGAPPTLLIHGARDPIVPAAQSEQLVASLRAYQRPVLSLQLPWATHSCDINVHGPCGQATLYAVERFLAQVLP